MDAAVAGFITIALVGGAQPWITLPPPAPVVIAPAAVPRTLRGWKELVECSAANGGPGNEQHLRRIAKADQRRGRWQPFWVEEGGGAVTAVDVELIQWLKLRRKPLGARKLGEVPSKKATSKKAKARR